jgi:hypothetical protein
VAIDIKKKRWVGNKEKKEIENSKKPIVFICKLGIKPNKNPNKVPKNISNINMI